MGKNELWEKNDENWPRNGKYGSYYYYSSSEFGGHFRTLRGGLGPHKPSQLIANGLGFLSM